LPPEPPERCLKSQEHVTELKEKFYRNPKKLIKIPDKRKSSTGSAVESLENLLTDMENFKNSKENKKSITVPINIVRENEMEKKLDDLTDKLIESFQNDDVKWNSVRESLGLCKSCEGKIFDEGIVTGDDMYHQDCFKCTHCGKRLGENYFLVGEDKYCEKHREVGLPKCKKCCKAITDGNVQVNGSPYHATCFCCSTCLLPIAGKFYTTGEGAWLCEQCYKDSKEKCAHCSLPMLDSVLTAMEKKYHPSCFRCNLCDVQLDGIPFILAEGSINCKQCYTKYKASKCAKCGFGIVGGKEEDGEKARMKQISINGLNFHQHCYTCKDCEKLLEGEYVVGHKDDIICFNCDINRRSTKRLL